MIYIILLINLLLLPKTYYCKTIKEVIASMFFYQNWQLAISNTDYLDASQMKTPIEHFWAMSIQGQFYIIWFLIFTIILFFIKRYSKINVKLLMNSILTLLFVSSLIYSIYLTYTNQQWAYFTTFTRVWEFSLGSLLCINLSSIKVSKIFASIIVWIGLVSLILTGVIFNVCVIFHGFIVVWPKIGRAHV